MTARPLRSVAGAGFAFRVADRPAFEANAHRGGDAIRRFRSGVITLCDTGGEVAPAEPIRRRDGAGPREAPIRIRLGDRRCRLVSEDEAASVTTIAHACGFTHLGRSSAAYGCAFGEPPSATRAASLRRTPARSG